MQMKNSLALGKFIWAVFLFLEVRGLHEELRNRIHQHSLLDFC